MTVAAEIAFALLAGAGLLCLVHLVRVDSTPDRIVALDLLLVIVVSAIGVQAARSGEGTYLDAVVVAALLGFVGTVTVARFMERRGTRQ